MNFINRLNPFKSDGPEPGKKPITMEDIIKSKTGSFTARAIGQIQTAWRTGGFVTDKAVAQFMNEHFKHDDVIHEKFKALIRPSGSDKPFEAKELKDNKLERRLSKIFFKASESQPVRWTDAENGMRDNYTVLKGLKAMGQYDPADLLRAVVYEKDKGIKPSNDLKQEFSEFVKGKDIKDENGLKAAYQDFKNKMEEDARTGRNGALEKMKSYPKDKSMEAYVLSGDETLQLDVKGVNKVQKMSVFELLNPNEKIVSEGSLKMAAYYQQAFGGAPEQSDTGTNRIESDFNIFLKEHGDINKKGFDRQNDYIIFQRGIISAAKEGDLNALEKLKGYLK